MDDELEYSRRMLTLDPSEEWSSSEAMVASLVVCSSAHVEAGGEGSGGMVSTEAAITRVCAPEACFVTRRQFMMGNERERGETRVA